MTQAQRGLCVEFQRQTGGFCALFSTPLHSVTSPRLCKAATSHFGASVRWAGGNASRLFWSRSVRPGRPLRAPPMREPFLLLMVRPPSRWMHGTSVDSRSRRHWCHVCCPTRAPRLPGPLPPLSGPNQRPVGLAIASRPRLSRGGLRPSGGRRSATSGGQGREHRPAN